MAAASKHPIRVRDTDASYMHVPWSTAAIRFSESLQLIDVHDCLAVTYGSCALAEVAQDKYFLAELHQTEDALGCSAGELVHHVKWRDAAGARVAVRVPCMRSFWLTVGHTHRAAEMAAQLNVDVCTAGSACHEDMVDDIDAAYVAAVPPPPPQDALADAALTNQAARGLFQVILAESDARVSHALQRLHMQRLHYETRTAQQWDAHR